MKILKIGIIITVVLLFLGTIPFAWQNGNDYDAFDDDVAGEFKLLDELCDSRCTNYPQDWVMGGNKLEAENFCLKQCMDRDLMKKNFESIVKDGFVYRSKIHQYVGTAYCVLGLNCINKDS